MKLNKKHNKHISNILPKHSAGERLWENIERRLDDTSTVIDNLPVHSAKPTLWEPIARSLSIAAQQKRRRRIFAYASTISGVAASVLLVLYFSFFNTHSSNQTASIIVFSEEVVEESPIALAANETKAETDFAIYCNQFPDVCTTPEFSQLQIKWEQLKAELYRLRTIADGGEEERLNVYIARIESDIQQLENRMMHMFM